MAGRQWWACRGEVEKMLTALTQEQEEGMVEWLSEHPVLWNKKMKDKNDIQMNIKPGKPPILFKNDTKAQRKRSSVADVVASA